MTKTTANLYGLTPSTSDKSQLYVQSTTQCVRPNPAQSAIFTPSTKGIKTISVSCNLDTLKATPLGTGTYNWYKNGVKVGTGQKFKPSQTGLYRCVYDENGCQSDSSAVIILKSIGAHNMVVSVIHLFPNPANRNVTVSGNGTMGSVRIYNAIGQLQINKEFPGNQTSMDIDIQVLSPGIYYVECCDKFGVQMQKQTLVVEH